MFTTDVCNDNGVGNYHSDGKKNPDSYIVN